MFQAKKATESTTTTQAPESTTKGSGESTTTTEAPKSSTTKKSGGDHNGGEGDITEPSFVNEEEGVRRINPKLYGSIIESDFGGPVDPPSGINEKENTSQLSDEPTAENNNGGEGGIKPPGITNAEDAFGTIPRLARKLFPIWTNA